MSCHLSQALERAVKRRLFDFKAKSAFVSPARVECGRSLIADANFSCFLVRLLNCFALSMSSTLFALYVNLHPRSSLSLCSTPASRLLALGLDELLLEDLDLDDRSLGEPGATSATARSFSGFGQG